MARLFLFNLSRKELQFWDESSVCRPAWNAVRDSVPSSWNINHVIVCAVADLKDHLYNIAGPHDSELRGQYNRDGLMTGFDVSIPSRRFWHVNDFIMLPANPNAKVSLRP